MNVRNFQTPNYKLVRVDEIKKTNSLITQAKNNDLISLRLNLQKFDNRNLLNYFFNLLDTERIHIDLSLSILLSDSDNTLFMNEVLDHLILKKYKITLPFFSTHILFLDNSLFKKYLKIVTFSGIATDRVYSNDFKHRDDFKKELQLMDKIHKNILLIEDPFVISFLGRYFDRCLDNITENIYENYQKQTGQNYNRMSIELKETQIFKTKKVHQIMELIDAQNK